MELRWEITYNKIGTINKLTCKHNELGQTVIVSVSNSSNGSNTQPDAHRARQPAWEEERQNPKSTLNIAIVIILKESPISTVSFHSDPEYGYLGSKWYDTVRFFKSH